jgi:hypothetical protein
VARSFKQFSFRSLMNLDLLIALLTALDGAEELHGFRLRFQGLAQVTGEVDRD